MEKSPREPFPYTEDFRRAKRNSLIWSGITIAFALGTPDPGHELSPMGSIGVNLGFSQDVLIVIAGCVAVFMGFGYWQAFLRVRNFARQIFNGNTDIERTFSELSQSALNASATINTARKNFPAASEVVFERARSILHDQTRGIEPKMDELKGHVQRVFDANLREVENFTKTEVDTISAKISKLRQFHDGIYFSDRLWFWCFDFGTVIVLGAIAAIPFLRVLICS